MEWDWFDFAIMMFWSVVGVILGQLIQRTVERMRRSVAEPTHPEPSAPAPWRQMQREAATQTDERPHRTEAAQTDERSYPDQRDVMVQSQCTYARHRAQPRMVPLGEGDTRVQFSLRAGRQACWGLS